MVQTMSMDRKRRAGRSDFWMAVALVAGGLAISGLSLARIATSDHRLAQVTPPAAPAADDPAVKDAPAEAKPGGTRPTTPAPEPARPGADARKAGAESALPPAPAEKQGAPINERSR